MALRLPGRGICLALGLCLVGMLSDTARSAQILVSPSIGTVARITISGDLDFSDALDFLRKTDQVKEAVVFFQSSGGNAAAGILIGRAIREKDFLTVVPPFKTCASACALAWLGGAQRFIGEGARVGFHKAYVMRGGRLKRSELANAAIAQYLSELDLSPQAVAYVTAAPPERIFWLTPTTARAVGIAIGRE